MRAERVELRPQPMAGLHEVVATDELSSFFGRAFEMILAELGRQGVEPAGPPTSLYRGVVSDKVDVTAGFPVDRPVTPTGGIVTVDLPGGPAVETIHVGPYDGLSATYAEIAQWMAGQSLTRTDVMWEQYLAGPNGGHDPAAWRTRVVYPIGS